MKPTFAKGLMIALALGFAGQTYADGGRMCRQVYMAVTGLNTQQIAQAREKAAEIQNDPTCVNGACQIVQVLDRTVNSSDAQTAQAAARLISEIESNGNGTAGISLTISPERRRLLEESCK